MLSDTMAMIFDDRRLIVDDSPLIFEISDDREKSPEVSCRFNYTYKFC